MIHLSYIWVDRAHRGLIGVYQHLTGRSTEVWGGVYLFDAALPPEPPATRLLGHLLLHPGLLRSMEVTKQPR